MVITNDRLEQSRTLKQELLQFTLDAEGELARSLETYCADQSRHWTTTGLNGINRLDLATEMFLTEGNVADQSVLDIFIQQRADLPSQAHALVRTWKRSFNGLFVVMQSTADGYDCMNWLTEKHYRVKPNGLQSDDELARLESGEMFITRIAPLSDCNSKSNSEDAAEGDWVFSGPMMLLGKLGKPKLAVAIGNFKNWFPHQLYGDAPDLLEEAWLSVERYHREFSEFFGGDRLTLSGHELGKKLKEYQDFTTQKQLDDAGIDSSKSLQEIAQQAGVTEEEIAETTDALGQEGEAAQNLFKSKKSLKMVMPSVELPKELRHAEAVTVFVHPRWGQAFLTDFSQLTELLSKHDEDENDEVSAERLDRLVQKYLNDPSVNVVIWRELAAEYPKALTLSLRRVTNNPDFTLERDLDATLVKFDKRLEPNLPEIASVPIHLHTLFQDALQEVSKKKTKRKGKKSAGFGS
ncbi:MAG: hypothetical protein VKL39_23080 [Leptolyngbyaceae bacterium]|nr:hypothetical protein [Leptolyngbyaceae bacterium]